MLIDLDKFITRSSLGLRRVLCFFFFFFFHQKPLDEVFGSNYFSSSGKLWDSARKWILRNSVDKKVTPQEETGIDPEISFKGKKLKHSNETN